MRVLVIVDYADPQISNFAIEDLRENDQIRKLF